MKLKTVKLASNEQIQAWKDQLPSDLTYGTFDEDFDVEGVHYEHGAWNSDGDWWMAWNISREPRGSAPGAA